MGIDGHHGPQGGNVALAAADYSFVIESGKGETCRGAAAAQQIEAFDRQSREPVFLHQLHQGLFHILRRRHPVVRCPGSVRIRSVQALEFADKLIDSDVYELRSEFRADIVEIDFRGDQPGRGSAYQSYSAVSEVFLGLAVVDVAETVQAASSGCCCRA